MTQHWVVATVIVAMTFAAVRRSGYQRFIKHKVGGGMAVTWITNRSPADEWRDGREENRIRAENPPSVDHGWGGSVALRGRLFDT